MYFLREKSFLKLLKMHEHAKIKSPNFSTVWSSDGCLAYFSKLNSWNFRLNTNDLLLSIFSFFTKYPLWYISNVTVSESLSWDFYYKLFLFFCYHGQLLYGANISLYNLPLHCPAIGNFHNYKNCVCSAQVCVFGPETLTCFGV